MSKILRKIIPNFFTLSTGMKEDQISFNLCRNNKFVMRFKGFGTGDHKIQDLENEIYLIYLSYLKDLIIMIVF